MDIKLASVLLSMTIALNGCATNWIVAEARVPSGRKILFEIDTEADHPTVSWRRTVWSGIGNPPTTGIRRRFVLKPDEETGCSEFDFYVNGCMLDQPTVVSPKSVDAPIPVTEHPPCAIMLTYGAVGEAGFYGLVVSTDKGPIREIPLTGNPYLWLLTPVGVAIDAAIVGTVAFVCVAGGCLMAMDPKNQQSTPVDPPFECEDLSLTP
jgi:hypothetical protein